MSLLDPSRAKCLLKRAALLAFSALLLLTIVIRVQQWRFRYRTEHLLQDIHSLQVRRTTFEEAMDVIERWKAWGFFFDRYAVGSHHLQNGRCTEAQCDFEIRLYSPVWWIGDRLYQWWAMYLPRDDLS